MAADLDKRADGLGFLEPRTVLSWDSETAEAATSETRAPCMAPT